MVDFLSFDEAHVLELASEMLFWVCLWSSRDISYRLEM
jgi:hypothetical protein